MQRSGLVFRYRDCCSRVTMEMDTSCYLLRIKNKDDTTCTVAFIDNGNVRHFTPDILPPPPPRHFNPDTLTPTPYPDTLPLLRHFNPDITRVNQTFPRLIISKRLVIMT